MALLDNNNNAKNAENTQNINNNNHSPKILNISENDLGTPKPILKRCSDVQHNIATDQSKRKCLSKTSITVRRRVPHNLVERRYRENLNGQIESLRMAIPSLTEVHNASIEDDVPSKTPSKAVIIAAATKYIKDLESEKRMLLSKTRDLQEQVAVMRELVNHEDARSNPTKYHIDHKELMKFSSR
ncbi:hypothetical protein M433DRAFT_1147 [Acidomyces richmondensis BFW]|nr:MAG: hypothetical protein FE78DRAFT_73289 [Acidomyces sp. 'richmondensis']KYG49427.1 hypothetical protein M433DRAFT_1147 [Acidomyces richmondensis BFW]